ncbi:hypothetical protein Slin15195_G025340 [Septoria linicola]|uniref:SMODS and SLOG-associating 2TM effector domain-containing protein n=1 Tax=Septoria linicola TaxID=215465 RepID=A0A9Q9EFQ8_9PEZI|nr:hypothetical protein Slin14017_G024420 [Septoria linicola]USW49215.1 hypothetical protein Slin15195_G025340 [Septoria linicola]
MAELIDQWPRWHRKRDDRKVESFWRTTKGWQKISDDFIMHELPKDLAKSLKSWRGSVYNEPVDFEKGHTDYGKKTVDLSASPEESAIVLHPSASSRSLRVLRQRDRQQQRRDGYRPVLPPEPEHEPKEDNSKHMNPKRITTLPPETPGSQKTSVYHHAPRVADPDPAADRLDDDPKPLTKEHFYELMGMHPPHGSLLMPKQLAVHGGLYSKIGAHLRYIQTKYRVFDVATYVLLVLQLLLSAVFIVLGSLTSVDSHVAIAILGAISVTVAGVLALMKGQGLPNRLRQTRDDLATVVFEAEESYWDVAADRHFLCSGVRQLREDYMRVLVEARKSHPDAFNSTANKIARGFRAPAAGKASTTVWDSFSRIPYDRDRDPHCNS